MEDTTPTEIEAAADTTPAGDAADGLPAVSDPMAVDPVVEPNQDGTKAEEAAPADAAAEVPVAPPPEAMDVSTPAEGGGEPTSPKPAALKLEMDMLSPNAAPPSGPKDRDIIIGEGATDHKANLLLQDLIALHRLLWEVTHDSMPKEDSEVEVLTERLFQLMKKGKGRDLAGMKDVPRPFLVGTGRFMRQEESGEWKELSDDDAKKNLRDLVFHGFNADVIEEDSATLKTLGKELHEFLLAQKKDGEAQEEITMKPTDVVVLQRTDREGDKSFDNQSGNKAFFILASQHVKSDITSPTKRLEAALSVFMSKPAGGPSETAESGDEKPRFILCTTGDEQKVFSQMNPVDAAEVTLLFVFEVWLEKENTSKPVAMGENSDMASNIDPKPSTDPVDKPTPHDVLFGRGGMTNSHPGNKRFRDVIALHRPDYIKAIKNDKPNVARRIVRAIRTASPPGRFLKKGDDGMWYDVGNKVAAEKASQALREKSNQEKRQRSMQREALRKRDESVDSSAPAKRSKTTDTAASISIVSPLLTTTQLNYVGAPTTAAASQTLISDDLKAVTKAVTASADAGKDELKTEGLPPNAVDKDGNILVTDWDILAGRGGLTNHHRGNKRFRDIVALHRPDYIRAPKVQKPSVARVIVRAIRNGDPPGRFLKKDDKTGKWYDIGDKKAAEKTSQALREKGNEKEGGRPSSGSVSGDVKSPAFLLPSPSGVVADPNALPALKVPPTVTVTTTDATPAETAAAPPAEAAETAAAAPAETATAPDVVAPAETGTVANEVVVASETPAAETAAAETVAVTEVPNPTTGNVEEEKEEAKTEEFLSVTV